MNELLQELFTTLEQLRDFINNASVSDSVRSEMDKLVVPLFADPESCQRITDMINDFGDFSENILVPLLEQYVSANVALRARFLVEDVLTAAETYRDSVLKKLAIADPRVRMHRQNSAGGKPFQGFGLVSATNHYRAALQQSSKRPSHNAKRFSRSNASNGQKNPWSAVALRRTSRRASVKPGPPGNNLHNLNKSFNADSARQSMVGIQSRSGLLRESNKLKVPKLKTSGQVLIRVLAVGLNHADYKSTMPVAQRISATLSKASPHIAHLTSLSKSFLSLTASATNINASTAPPHSMRDASPTDAELVGVEFCGIVEDIAWKKGDYLHRLHVSRDDTVFGVMSSSPGAMAEYLVCDVNDIARVPSSGGLTPAKAAALAVDGAVVCRSLADTDLNNGTQRSVLIVGGNTNAGLILMELLTKDLGLNWGNIHILASSDHFSALGAAGALGTNLYDATGANMTETLAAIPGNLDIIFDCLAETEFKLSRSSNAVDLRTKLKGTGQYFSMDSGKLLAEKRIKKEGWQRELNLISRLVSDKKLVLAGDAAVSQVEFTKDDVSDAIKELKSGMNLGKLVVSLSQEKVNDMRKEAARAEAAVGSEL